MESRDTVIFAVADAHYGPESSHTLVDRLFNRIISSEIPNTQAELSFVLDSLQEGPYPETESETTLLVAIYDKTNKTGFGVSFGDSSLVIAGVRGVASPTRPQRRYVSTSPDQLPLEGATFTFTAQKADTLVSSQTA